MCVFYGLKRSLSKGTLIKVAKKTQNWQNWSISEDFSSGNIPWASKKKLFFYKSVLLFFTKNSSVFRWSRRLLFALKNSLFRCVSKGILLYGNLVSFWIIDISMGDLFSSCAFFHTFCKSLKKRPSANNRLHFTTKSCTSLNILVGKTSCFLNIQGKEAFEQQFWWNLW